MTRSEFATRAACLLAAMWLSTVLLAMPETTAQQETPPTTPAQPDTKPAPPPDQEPADAGAAPKPTPAPSPLVWAEPNPCLPGQSITFRTAPEVWKLIGAGGGLGARAVAAADTPLADTPAKPTTYRFEAWTRTKPAPGSPATVGHKKLTVLVDVYPGKFPALATYHDRRGWRIDYLKGWPRFDSPQDDPAENALMYFETSEDAAERLAVAMLPVGDQTAGGLMDKVMSDAPTQYDVIKDITRKDTTQAGEPAVWVTFGGLDRALPGVPISSMVLAVVHKKIGYVISARAQETGMDTLHQRMLRCLVRSFAFETKAAVGQPAAGSRQPGGRRTAPPSPRTK